MKVLKFGGSSVKDADKIRHVAEIIDRRAEGGPICVVLSAMRGITDDLIKAAKEAEAGRPGHRAIIEGIRKRQVQAAESLFSVDAREKALKPLLEMCREAEDILHGIELVKECSARSMDLVMSFGERLNCSLVASYLSSLGIETDLVDTRSVIVTDDRYGSAVVDFRTSYRNIKKRIGACKGVAIATGFIAATAEGVTTTLGRNGSDYTASIIAAGLGADSIEIWKDVDGVLSADPGSVKDAFVIDEVSYEEAMEMSFFGAEVIHPYTMIPAIEKNIPIRIKNTLNPAVKGTLITRDIKPHGHPITGIASIENVALINVEGSGMLGIPGIASRVFSSLAKSGVNVVMISQASSEHSICIVCREEQAQKAVSGLRAELVREIEARQIENFELIKGLEIVAIIGENMRGTPGISGRLFSALGEKKINVLAIAQGSSERNISFVIENKDREVALNTVHRAFFGDGGKKVPKAVKS